MNVVEPPPSQSGDDLDALLRAFLRSQMPQPWPPPRLLSDVTSCRRRATLGRSLMRSRWALAASIALLFFGAWLLPDRFTSEAKLEHGPNGPMISENPRDMPKQHNKNRNEAENKNKLGLAADKDDPMPELEGSDVPMFR